MDHDALHGALLRALEAHLPHAIALRRELHAHPEVSGEEHWTAERVTAALPSDDVHPVAGTGRLVHVGTSERPVAIRAELDALPIVEQSGAAFASTNGAMHACGHDIHLAALVAVTQACADVGAPVLALLQPREERAPSGARDIVSDGVLRRAGAHAVVAVHVNPTVDGGHVALDPGVVNAGSDEIEIAVTGHGGHGGYPHLANDPVPALCETVSAVQHAIRSSVDPLHPAAISIGQLEAGAAPNVIPNSARAAGTIRTFYPDDRARLHERIRQLATATATGHGCQGNVTITEVEPPLHNDPRLAVASRERLISTGIPLAPEFRSCGADDFSFYGRVHPSLMAFLGTGQSVGSGAAVSLHDPRYLPPDDTVRQAAQALIACYVAALDVQADDSNSANEACC